jgi:hypothetical protein
MTMSEILTGTPSGGRPDSSPGTSKVIHPVRGVLWGLLLGLGLAGLLVSLKVVSLGLVTLIVLVLVGIVLWSTFGPARPASGLPPEQHPRPQPPEVSRLDDFTDPPPSTTA